MSDSPRIPSEFSGAQTEKNPGGKPGRNRGRNSTNQTVTTIYRRFLCRRSWHKELNINGINGFENRIRNAQVRSSSLRSGAIFQVLTITSSGIGQSGRGGFQSVPGAR
jgi:hypothetical protein